MKAVDRTEFVICTDNRSNPASLELHKVYRTLPDLSAEEDGWIRVIDEDEEDYLYPADMFEPIELKRSVQQAIRTRGGIVSRRRLRRTANGKKKVSKRVA